MEWTMFWQLTILVFLVYAGMDFVITSAIKTFQRRDND